MDEVKEKVVEMDSKGLETIPGPESTTMSDNNKVVEDSSSAENKLTSKSCSEQTEKGTPKTEIGFKLPQLPVVFRSPKSSKLQPAKLQPAKLQPASANAVGSVGNVSDKDKSLNTASKPRSKPTQEEGSSQSENKDNETTLVVEPQTDKVEENENIKTTSDVDLSKDEEMMKTEQNESSFVAPLLPPKHAKLCGPTKPPSDLVKAKSESDESSSGKPSKESTSKERTPSSKSTSKLSPAEKIAQAVPIPYKEPSWAGVPQQPYHLEVLKGGSIITTLPLNEKSFLVFGRLESCDVMLEHPSLSRFHMVLQYRSVGDSDNDPGFYVYDLDSTHGSTLNKVKLKPKMYCRMRVGHMFKLAGSTRLYILQGPAEDQEADLGLSVAELKYLREKQLAEREKQKVKEKEEEEEKVRQEEEAKGISWGMDDEAEEEEEEEEPSEVNPFALMTTEEREELYIKDPKKTLRGFFEREGFELEYNVEEQGIGHTRQYICRVELPIDDADGHPITAEAAVGGKKKEAVVACALEACRILDTQGVLRQAKHESKKRKAKNWAEDDYYDSDEDTFLDRTGEIEKKRKARMKKAGVLKDEVETFASLTAKMANVEAEIKHIDEEITTINNTSAQTSSDDSLDAFMSSIKSGTVHDKTRRAKLKIQKIELKKEQSRLMKLINIARPAALPEIQRKYGLQSKSPGSGSAVGKKLPMIGSMKGRLGAKKFKFLMPAAKPTFSQAVSSTADDMVEEEEEEEEDEEEEVSMEITSSTQPGNKVKDLSGPTGDTTPDISAGDAGMKHTTDEMGTHKDTGPQRVQLKGPERGPTKGPQRGPSKDPQTTLPKGPQVAPSSKGPSKSDYQRKLGNVDDDDDHDAEPKMRKKPAKKVVAMETEEDVPDWVPPKGQTGDGRTSLNDKYGY